MNHPYSDSKTWVPYATLQYECGNAKDICVLLIKLDVSTFQMVESNHQISMDCCQQTSEVWYVEKDCDGAPFQSAII